MVGKESILKQIAAKFQDGQLCILDNPKYDIRIRSVKKSKMKRLALSTIQRAFILAGFERTDNGMCLFREQYNSARLSVSFYPQIKVEEGRWLKSGRPGWNNVHIVSYWGWPSSIKELKITMDGIRMVYSELCGTRFNS